MTADTDTFPREQTASRIQHLKGIAKRNAGSNSGFAPQTSSTVKALFGMQKGNHFGLGDIQPDQIPEAIEAAVSAIHTIPLFSVRSNSILVIATYMENEVTDKPCYTDPACDINRPLIALLTTVTPKNVSLHHGRLVEALSERIGTTKLHPDAYAACDIALGQFRDAGSEMYRGRKASTFGAGEHLQHAAYGRMTAGVFCLLSRHS
jgi:hypothetical protein